jgi:hypothetical protein
MGIAERDADRPWVVHRQNDNGNRVIVCSGHEREDADRLAAEAGCSPNSRDRSGT